MKGRNIWVLSAFSDPRPEAQSDRYRFICDRLHQEGARVCQFISRFHHGSKETRVPPPTPWRCVTVFEPGYRSNVSLGRILSHACFDGLIGLYFMREWLRGGRPTTILTALPHNGAGLVACLVAKLTGARMVVDIHDTWPESLLGVTRIRAWQRPLFRAWKALADAAIRMADFVFAESKRYAERADQVRCPLGLSPAQTVYLGGDLAYYKVIPPLAERPPLLEKTTFLVAYVGTLGVNYDLDTLLEAFAGFQAAHPEAGLMLLGGGEREGALRARIQELGLRAWVSGRIPHNRLIGYLKHCQVGVNGFKAGGNVAYSYKLNDYWLSGIPVANSLPGEVAEFVSNNALGYNYPSEDSESLRRCLEKCHSHWHREPHWKGRILIFAEQLLDRQQIYKIILKACL